MKTLIACIILIHSITSTNGQNVFNPYRRSNIPLSEITLPISNKPDYKWYNRGSVTGYSGEYEILFSRHPWNIWLTGNPRVHITYSMEVVSFPFTNSCAFQINGCAGSVGRNFFMPTTPLINNKWGALTNYFQSLTNLIDYDQTLVSYGFQTNSPVFTSPTNNCLPQQS